MEAAGRGTDISSSKVAKKSTRKTRTDKLLPREAASSSRYSLEYNDDLQEGDKGVHDIREAGFEQDVSDYHCKSFPGVFEMLQLTCCHQHVLCRRFSCLYQLSNIEQIPSWHTSSNCAVSVVLEMGILSVSGHGPCHFVPERQLTGPMRFPLSPAPSQIEERRYFFHGFTLMSVVLSIHDP